MKIDNDKYYTPVDLAKRLIDKTYEIIGINYITETIEPSAGSGSFSNQIDNCIAYDLVPESANIIQANFLELDLDYKKGRLFIGNPPFGRATSLAKQFYKKAVKYSDYIAFILPVSQLNQNVELFDFDLIYSEDLGLIHYTDRELNCCFNIYKRPLNGLLNLKRKYEFKDIKMNVVSIGKGRNDKIPEKYDLAICSWGSIGKIALTEGQYNTTIYIQIFNDDLREEIIKFFKTINWLEHYKMISTPKLNLWQVYEQLLIKFPNLS